ncbi:MAG: hypothetical protein ACO1QS_01940 [Verrucomicrobiota bacterium]
MTGTAPETPAETNGNPPRKLMRVTIVSLATLFFSGLITAFSEGDFINPQDWGDSLLGLVVLGVMLWFMLLWTWRAWDQPTGKSDRVILFLGITMLISSPFDAVTRALPNPWADYWDTATMLPIFPLVFWAYRKLERKWTVEGDLLALAEPGPWPTNRHFLIFFGIILMMDLMYWLPDEVTDWLMIPVVLLSIVIWVVGIKYAWAYLREKKIVS